MMSVDLAASAATNCPTVLIADGHPLVRVGLKVLIAELLGEAEFLEVSDGDALLIAAQRASSPQLAVIDVKMVNMQEGLRLSELADRQPALPIVVISALESQHDVERILSIPTVHAFVPKTASSAATRDAIKAALMHRKLPWPRAAVGSTPRQVSLTPRQQEICKLLRQGLRNKTIAHILGITEGTVKNHITEILRALKATNRTQAAHFGSSVE